MSASSSKLSLITEDLKTSWYFRIWALTWVVCAVVGAIGFIILAHSSDQASQKRVVESFVTKEAELPFPDFEFRLPTIEGNVTYYQITEGVKCEVGPPNLKAFVTMSACPSFEPQKKCVYAHARHFVASPTNDVDNYQDDLSHILCFVTVHSPPTQSTPVLAFQLSDTAPVLLEPRQPLVLVSKTEIRTKEHDGNLWTPDVSYFTPDISSVVNGDHRETTFRVVVGIRNFFVQHTQEVDTFNGWQSVGSIGGFIFFLVILHNILMFLVGFCLANDSKFLGGGADAAGSAKSAYTAF